MVFRYWAWKLKRISKGNNSESQNTTESENEVILEIQQQNQETIEDEPPVITNQLTAGEKYLIEKITNNITDIPDRVPEYKFHLWNQKIKNC